MANLLTECWKLSLVIGCSHPSASVTSQSDHHVSVHVSGQLSSSAGPLRYDAVRVSVACAAVEPGCPAAGRPICLWIPSPAGHTADVPSSVPAELPSVVELLPGLVPVLQAKVPTIRTSDLTSHQYRMFMTISSNTEILHSLLD